MVVVVMQEILERTRAEDSEEIGMCPNQITGLYGGMLAASQ